MKNTLFSNCWVLRICKKNSRLFKTIYKKKTNYNYNYSDWSVLIQIQFLLVRINRNQQNYNKNEKFFYSWINEMKQKDIIMKNTCRYHYQNLNDMIYSSWDIEQNKLKLVILGHFLPFIPLKTPKIKILKNEKIC